MTLHSAQWIKILITFLPDILNLLKDLLKDVPEERIIHTINKGREITKKIEASSTGGQRETWGKVNQVADAIFSEGRDRDSA